MSRSRRHWQVRLAAVMVAAACAALATGLPAGRGLAGQPEPGRRAANAEVLIITRGALEGGLSPSG